MQSLSSRPTCRPPARRAGGWTSVPRNLRAGRRRDQSRPVAAVPQQQQQQQQEFSTTTSSSSAQAHKPHLALRLRPGQPSDLPIIVNAVLRHWMNPLGLTPSRFLVATAIGTQDHPHLAAPGVEEVAGIGQLKPLGPRGGGQEGQDWELATLVTLEAYRGRGVASEVVRSLLRQAHASDRVLLLCTDRATKFYGRFGFQEVDPQAQSHEPLPGMLQFEWALGNQIAPRVKAGTRLAIMVWHPPHHAHHDGNAQ